jgi:lysophospholipase L1-like esterase
MPLKGLLHNLLLSLLTLCGCFAMGEVAARLLLPPHPIYRVPQPVHEPHPAIGWVLRPDQDAFTQAEPLHINTAGLRDDDEVLAKPRSERRVLVIGDSVTFGNGVATQKTYPAVLEELLAQRGVQARVLNGGVQGYDIHQEASFLHERGWDFEPDVVVLGFFENDVILRSDGEGYLSRVGEGGEFAGGRLRGAIPTELVYLVKRLRLVVWIGNLLREMRWRFFPPEADYHVQSIFFDRPSPNSERAWEQVSESLRAIQQEAGAREVEVVLAIFPHHGQMLEGALVHTYQGRIHQIAQGLETVDLLDDYRASTENGVSPFIPYDGHPNAAGHRIAAEALVEPVAAALARQRAGHAEASP